MNEKNYKSLLRVMRLQRIKQDKFKKIWKSKFTNLMLIETLA